MTNLPVDADRLWGDVMALARITDTARPYTRRSFSPLFLAGRDFLAARFQAAGLATRIDCAGNLIGRREGRDPTRGAIALGSHSDTVPAGGRFDGIAGVAAGLEVARALHEAGDVLDHPLEIIDFLAEEPSEFGLSCIGSRGMSGALDASMLDLREPGGEVLGAALRRVGGDPDRIHDAVRADVAAFLELHIEQGPVLETSGCDVGIVTSIVGIRRIEIVFDGAADHAGTTPMDLRRDALVAGARTVDAIRRMAEELAAAGDAYFVATAGLLTVEPGASNVVPDRCRLIVDIRSTDPSLTAAFTARLDDCGLALADAARVSRGAFAMLSDAPPVACDPLVQAALRQGAQDLGLRARDLPSGAGHDAAFMTRICRSGMVFVPCRGGRSHTPEEWAERDALAAGAATMLKVVRSLDLSLPTV